MTTTINITVIPEREYKISVPAGVLAYYSDILVGGSGTKNVFIAIEGVTTLRLESASPITGQVTITEILRSFYSPEDDQGGVCVYQQAVDRWTSRYSYRPDCFGNVNNRLVTFKGGMPYIFTGANNSFFGRVDDSALAMAHSEAGNSIKEYRSVAVEGDTPDITHIRTEVPYVQSSDLRVVDYTVKEGVAYAGVLRDRLSPNTTGTFDQKVFKGDVMRGELGKIQLTFQAPATRKEIKFFNIDFDQSRGQTV